MADDAPAAVFFNLTYALVPGKEDKYKAYGAAVKPTLPKGAIEFVSVDTAPVAVEEGKHSDKVVSVVLRFSSRADFDSWYTSAAYQKILPLRTESTVTYQALLTRAGVNK